MTTKPTRGHAITTAVFSILKILIAIVVFVLGFDQIFDRAYDIATETKGIYMPVTPGLGWWGFGLPFLIPGVMGLVAARVRNSVSYGLYMAACIIGCVVDGVFCFWSFTFLLYMASMGGLDCHDVGGQCVCTTGDFTGSSPVGITDCYDLGKLVHMSYGWSAMMILGWVLLLAGSIISCVSCCCCGQREPAQVVMIPSYPCQEAISTSHYTPPQYAGPENAAVPQYAAPPGDSVEDGKNQYKYNRMY